jgi:cell wall-associated NlpC family hydrolase
MKQIIKRVLIVTLYMGLILVSTNVYARSAKAKEETVRLRKEPSTNSSIIELISQNEEVEILEETGDWYKVKYQKYTGYVRKDMLSENTDKNENSGEKANNGKTEEKPEEENNNNNQSSEEPKEEDNSNQSEEQQNNEQQEQDPKEPQTNMVQKGYSGNLKSKLDIKILPLINSSNIETINENTKFTITDIINKWCYVETENNSGWALISKVKTEEDNKEETNQEDKKDEKPSENKDDEEQNKDDKDNQNKEQEENKEITKYVSAETLNVREKDDNNSKIISQLTLNTKVTVVEMVNSTWAKITVKGKTGYVANKYLSDKKVDTSSRSEEIKREENNKTNEQQNENKIDSEPKQETPNQSTTSNTGLTGESVVAFAKKYLGYKYVSGGASPSTGFDCSGFTSYVYKNFGINLSRTSGAQASNGVAVSKSNLKAGDLVIFNNSSNSAIGHVGIYIGGNTFIHAANAKKGVITTSLSDSYYSRTYVTARRVIN